MPMRSFVPTVSLLAALTGGTAAGQLDLPFPAVFELADLLPLNGGDGSIGFVLEGAAPVDNAGTSVSSVGDVNGDGFGDVIIGAPEADPNGVDRAGESYVVFGGPGVAFGGIRELALLDGTNGFVLNGVERSDRSGIAVSSAGDFNDDGYDDILIGAWFASRGEDDLCGDAYVVFGGADIGSGGMIELSALNGSNGFTIDAIRRFDRTGATVAHAGDVNGDGYDDVIVGAYDANAYRADPSGSFEAGESYVIFGGPAVGATGASEVASLDGVNGFVLNGIDVSDRSGSSVSSAGDVNADGIDDLIIGAPFAAPNGKTQAGESYVVFGAVGIAPSGSMNLADLDGTNGFVIHGEAAEHFSGSSVSSAGDVNADGIDDLIIGAPEGVNRGSGGQGYVVFGSPGVGSSGVIELASLTGADGFVMRGLDHGDTCGAAVSSAGDVNGDGIGDVVIGAPHPNRHRLQNGESYVVFGRPGLGAEGVIDLQTLNGLNGVLVFGVDTTDQSGTSVSSAGDFNGDGIDDIIIGASHADPDPGSDRFGEAYVVFGRDLSSFCVADTNGDGMLTPADFNGWILAFNDRSAACDQNDDGLCTPADFNGWIINYNAGC